eukprot:g4517.t1
MGEDAPKENDGPKCILLYSSCCMDPIQDQDQRRCRDLMKGKGVPYQQVDGSEGSDRELRNTLWSVSGHRGKYPQVFIERDGEHEFVGLWSDIEGLNECEELPPEILAANPEIKTFRAVFGALMVDRGPPRPPGGGAPAGTPAPAAPSTETSSAPPTEPPAETSAEAPAASSTGFPEGTSEGGDK